MKVIKPEDVLKVPALIFEGRNTSRKRVKALECNSTTSSTTSLDDHSDELLQYSKRIDTKMEELLSLCQSLNQRLFTLQDVEIPENNLLNGLQEQFNHLSTVAMNSIKLSKENQKKLYVLLANVLSLYDNQS